MCGSARSPQPPMTRDEFNAVAFTLIGLVSVVAIVLAGAVKYLPTLFN